jgi:hypothetical protein
MMSVPTIIIEVNKYRGGKPVDEEAEDTLVIVDDIDSSETYYQHTDADFGRRLLTRSAFLANRRLAAAGVGDYK